MSAEKPGGPQSPNETPRTVDAGGEKQSPIQERVDELAYVPLLEKFAMTFFTHYARSFKMTDAFPSPNIEFSQLEGHSLKNPFGLKLRTKF